MQNLWKMADRTAFQANAADMVLAGWQLQPLHRGTALPGGRTARGSTAGGRVNFFEQDSRIGLRATAAYPALANASALSAGKRGVRP